MIRANRNDKQTVVEILFDSFKKNLAIRDMVNAQKNPSRESKIRNLMKYCFELGMMQGEVFLSEDRKGCAIIIDPGRRRNSMKLVVLNVKLIFEAIGIFKVFHVLKRENMLKTSYPDEKGHLILWCIGVHPKYQKFGIGNQLLREVTHYSDKLKRALWLETAVMENCHWYLRKGFELVRTLTWEYKLYVLKRDHHETI